MSEYFKINQDKELAKYLGLDVRTLRKYADNYHGVAVLPNKFMFFEKELRRIIENAKFNNKERNKEIQSQCANSWRTRQKEAKAVSRQKQKVLQGSSSVGKTDKKRTENIFNRHELLDCDGMG